ITRMHPPGGIARMLEIHRLIRADRHTAIGIAQQKHTALELVRSLCFHDLVALAGDMRQDTDGQPELPATEGKQPAQLLLETLFLYRSDLMKRMQRTFIAAHHPFGAPDRRKIMQMDLRGDPALPHDRRL